MGSSSSSATAAATAEATTATATDDIPAFANPLRAAGARPSPIDAVVVVPPRGSSARLLARPWVGLLCALAAGLVLAWPRLRPVLTLGAPGRAASLCALYIVVQQHRYDYVSDLDWPNRFHRVNDVAWLAVLLLLTDVLVQWARRRGQRRTAAPDDGAPPDGSAPESPDRRAASRG